jgi:predicted lipoprotein with Yx(FWY)xxD motif
MRRQLIKLLLAAGVGGAVLAGVALAKSYTLKIAHNGKVTNQHGATTHEPIVVSSRGFAVYTLSGDSKRHPECTKANRCFSFWPPVTVTAAGKPSAQPGIRGKLGIWRRDGFRQVTLGGHPLNTFAPDKHKDWATGEGIVSFGGTWHAVRGSGGMTRGASSMGTTTTTTTSSESTTSTTTTTTACAYPPYC